LHLTKNIAITAINNQLQLNFYNYLNCKAKGQLIQKKNAKMVILVSKNLEFN